ncbi:hypothetical protein Dimus_020890 [Dionaea muscipula]
MSYSNWQSKPEWHRFDRLQMKFEIAADNVIYSEANTHWMEDMLDKMIEQSAKLKEEFVGGTMSSMQGQLATTVRDLISRKRAKQNQIKRRQGVVDKAIQKTMKKTTSRRANAIETQVMDVDTPNHESVNGGNDFHENEDQANVNNVYVPMMIGYSAHCNEALEYHAMQASQMSVADDSMWNLNLNETPLD